MTKFIPQRKNANKHTQHGMRLLEKSIQQDGWMGAQTAAADGEMIAGSARLEVAADKFADVEPIVVDSDGKRPVIIRRTDIPSADDPRARRLSIADNQIAYTDWNPDSELLKEWGNEDKDIRAMFADSEWSRITGEVGTIGEDEAFSKLPDSDRAPFQQMTFTVHDAQAEQVRNALKLAKAAGEFVDSENENSNGNALARICETYITEHGNG